MTSTPPPAPAPRIDRVIIDSLDFTVARLLERLDGLGDDEFVWEPAQPSWNVRATADGPRVETDPDRRIDPAPFTTIAWRLWHLSSDCCDEYTARFSGEPLVEVNTQWTFDATEAVQRFTASWQAFRSTLVAFDDWFVPLGDAFGPFHQHGIADFAMHAGNELAHHGAEIAVLRDLYRTRSD